MAAQGSCIFCATDATGAPVEHVIPESLGGSA